MNRPIGLPRFRWVIVAMLAAAAMLNYVDRQTLALMASAVQADLAIDDAGYAWLVNMFLAAYMIGGLVSAAIVDRIGARRSMLLFVGWWSLASALSGAVNTAWQLGAARFALGIAEAGNWIASPKLVQQWLPQRERGLAIGVYSSAAHFGAALSPLVITALLLGVGWRLTFVVTGVAGIAWVAAWLLLYRPDRQAPSYDVGETPIAPPLEPATAAPAPTPAPSASWLAVLRTRPVWWIAIGHALTNPVWFFYLFWFPKYLTEERGLTVAAMGRLSWIVYAAAGFGSVLGGALSGWFIRRGWRADRARVAAMTATAIVAPLGALNALAPAVAISLALGAVVALAHTAWVTNQTALFVDLYPAPAVGKAMAIQGLVGGIATMGSTWAVGQLVSTVTYRPMFLLIAVAYPLGLVFINAASRSAEGARA